MRRHRNRQFNNWHSEYSGVYGNNMSSGSITINNITNVTNVTSVANVVNASPWQGHRADKSHRRVEGRERKPKLLHFYETCGMCDQDKVSKMNESEFIDGSVDVLKYGARSVKESATGLVTGVSSGVGRMIGGTFRFLETIFG